LMVNVVLMGNLGSLVKKVNEVLMGNLVSLVLMGNLV
jgi:hypothetical protein